MCNIWELIFFVFIFTRCGWEKAKKMRGGHLICRAIIGISHPSHRSHAYKYFHSSFFYLLFSFRNKQKYIFRLFLLLMLACFLLLMCRYASGRIFFFSFAFHLDILKYLPKQLRTVMVRGRRKAKVGKSNRDEDEMEKKVRNNRRRLICALGEIEEELNRTRWYCEGMKRVRARVVWEQNSETYYLSIFIHLNTFLCDFISIEIHSTFSISLHSFIHSYYKINTPSCYIYLHTLIILRLLLLLVVIFA